MQKYIDLILKFYLYLPKKLCFFFLILYCTLPFMKTKLDVCVCICMHCQINDLIFLSSNYNKLIVLEVVLPSGSWFFPNNFWFLPSGGSPSAALARGWHCDSFFKSSIMFCHWWVHLSWTYLEALVLPTMF